MNADADADAGVDARTDTNAPTPTPTPTPAPTPTPTRTPLRPLFGEVSAGKVYDDDFSTDPAGLAGDRGTWGVERGSLNITR